MRDQSNPVERLAFTIDEVCQSTTIGRTKVFELISLGELHTVKVGKRRLVPRDSLVSFLASLSETA